MKYLLTLLLAMVMIGCGTVTPTIKKSDSHQLVGNQVTAGPYLAVTPNGYILNDQLRAEYNSLAKKYPNGILGAEFHPPLVADAGITLVTSGSYRGRWLQDGQHNSYFRRMRDWSDNGKTAK
jgi:hypothetical protein